MNVEMKPFADAYIAAPRPPPTRAAIDVTLMMLPRPPWRMCGTAAEHAATTERTLRSITASKNASSISAIGTR